MEVRLENNGLVHDNLLYLIGSPENSDSARRFEYFGHPYRS